jgi:hypothetical protein
MLRLLHSGWQIAPPVLSAIKVKTVNPHRARLSIPADEEPSIMSDLMKTILAVFALFPVSLLVAYAVLVLLGHIGIL